MWDVSYNFIETKTNEIAYNQIITWYDIIWYNIIIWYSPGKPTGRELSPRVNEIETSGFQQNVRLEILNLAPQEQNLGHPWF